MNSTSERGRRRIVPPGLRPVAAVGAALLCAVPAVAQLSADSWWPKFQRDAQNSGYVPLLAYAGDAHVIWTVPLCSPLDAQSYATPVLSPDGARLYVGGPASTLTAIDIATASIVWTLTLGDGTGIIHQTAAVAADGSIYVGAWDDLPPCDGFCKVQDQGDHAELVWTFPMCCLLASPTITNDGLIIVAGQHENEDWAFFALEDLGQSWSLVWQAGQLADPQDPNSTGSIGASPALSPDGAWVFGGSFDNTTFWQIDAVSGFEAARVALDYYCYAASPVVSDDGFAFVGEGMSFSNPDPQTQGKLYAMQPDQQGVVDILLSEPLRAGHLNGGTAALHRRANGPLRLYVPANGFGRPNASLIAVDFDPDTPALEKIWEVSVGASALAYPQAVVTRDEVVYVPGPGSHRLYAVRDGGGATDTLWTVSLHDISRADTWEPSELGAQGVVIGPDGTIYWNAADGYLYALSGWLTGDLDSDGQLTDQDLHWLVIALADPEQYELRFPEIDATAIADVNGDNRLDFFDLNRMIELLAGG